MPEYFLPNLFNSQIYEQVFRAAGSVSSTFYTATNFSVLEILHRAKRLQSHNEILNSDRKKFIFNDNKWYITLLVKKVNLYRTRLQFEIRAQRPTIFNSASLVKTLSWRLMYTIFF